MKKIIFISILSLVSMSISAQKANTEIPEHIIKPVEWKERMESPPYIDSALFARYIDWQLQPDSLPKAVKPTRGYTIEIMYVVSKEGKIIIAKSRTNEKNTLNDFILQKFISCPYQWSPAYQNGRPVNYYHRMKIIF